MLLNKENTMKLIQFAGQILLVAMTGQVVFIMLWILSEQQATFNLAGTTTTLTFMALSTVVCAAYNWSNK